MLGIIVLTRMQTSGQMPRTWRFDGVDVLRGLSILAVILLHTLIRLHAVGISLDEAMPHWAFHLLFRNGNNGVTVFFAISGFLITFTSLRRFGELSDMQPVKFYRIRFARIAPLLLLTLAVLSTLHLVQAPGFYISPQRATLGRALFAALTFHLNWLEAVRGYLPLSWDVLREQFGRAIQFGRRSPILAGWMGSRLVACLHCWSTDYRKST